MRPIAPIAWPDGDGAAQLVVVRLGFSGSFSGVEWGPEPMLAAIIAATDG